jgi:hypothetical protein
MDNKLLSYYFGNWSQEHSLRIIAVEKCRGSNKNKSAPLYFYNKIKTLLKENEGLWNTIPVFVFIKSCYTRAH